MLGMTVTRSSPLRGFHFSGGLILKHKTFWSVVLMTDSEAGDLGSRLRVSGENKAVGLGRA